MEKKKVIARKSVKPTAKKQTVFYAVEAHSIKEVTGSEIYPRETMEEAYKDALEDVGTGDLYAYEIRYLGKIKNEFKIEP